MRPTIKDSQNHDSSRTLARRCDPRPGAYTKSRIETEITAHYEEAYRVALDKGLTDEEAEALALESLGDVEKARLQFKDTYLSEKEEFNFAFAMGINRLGFKNRLWFTDVYIFLFYVVVSLSMFNANENIYGIAAWILLGLAFIWAAVQVTRGHTRYSIFNHLRMFPIFLYVLSPTNASDYWLMTTLQCLAMALYAVSAIRMYTLLRKVPKHLDNEERELLKMTVQTVNKRGYIKS